MKLFEVVPGNFFSILSSGNREIYYDALMVLHDMFKFELNIRVDDFIASLITLLEDRAFELEDDDDAQESGLTLSGKARIILDRFVKTGWVDKEFVDNSFIEIVTPRNYAIPVIKLLSELGENALLEYNSLVFATYSGLKQAMSENESHIYEALLSAKANTEQLQYSLRTLYHGIRGFLRGIVDQQDINLLLQDHFGEYKIYQIVFITQSRQWTPYTQNSFPKPLPSPLPYGILYWKLQSGGISRETQIASGRGAAAGGCFLSGSGGLRKRRPGDRRIR